MNTALTGLTTTTHALESSLSLVLLKLVTSRNHFLWFGHLGGPIMEDCVSFCVCKFTKKDVGNHVFSFQQNKGAPGHRRGFFQQNKGSFQHNKGK